MTAKIRRPLSPARYLFLMFLAAVLAGSFLLYLPVSRNEGFNLSFLDALFTAVSAVCVTGLTTVDIHQVFSPFGWTVIALLIMIGGMGVAGLIVSTALFLGFRVGLSQRIIVQASYNIGSLKGTLTVLKTVVLSSAAFQLLGAAFYYRTFRALMGPLDAVGYSLFHAISAFNNAGFDLMGSFSSISQFSDDGLYIMITSVLIIAGGLGFFVIADTIRSGFSWKHMTMHSKMVYCFTLLLLVVGVFLFLVPGDISVPDALFLSVTARTAGFSTLDIGTLRPFAVLILMTLMFIGASPGSTGGGVKTTTLLTILLSLNPLKRTREVVLFSRSIDEQSVQKAYQVLALGLFTVVGSTGVLLAAEQNMTASVSPEGFSPFSLLFESVSAFATVGLSTGVTPYLSGISKGVLMLSMFIGRVGPITIASTILRKESKIGYIRERVFIG